MKFKKILLLGVASILMSCSAIAESLVSQVVDVGFIKPAEVVQLKAFPELTTQPAEVLTVFTHEANVNSVMVITDYGAIEERQVNSNKLAYRESNVLVANFAKVQNANFERTSKVA